MNGRSFDSGQNERLRSALRGLMVARGWGQREAANALGVSQQTISGFLAERWGAGYPLARSIADALGTGLDDVVGGSVAAPAPVLSVPTRQHGRGKKLSRSVIHDSLGRRMLVAFLRDHSTARIAELCGAAQTAVSAWSTGLYRPSFDVRTKIEAVLGIAASAWSESPLPASSGLRRPFVTVVAPLPELVFLDAHADAQVGA